MQLSTARVRNEGASLGPGLEEDSTFTMKIGRNGELETSGTEEIESTPFESGEKREQQHLQSRKDKQPSPPSNDKSAKSSKETPRDKVLTIAEKNAQLKHAEAKNHRAEKLLEDKALRAKQKAAQAPFGKQVVRQLKDEEATRLLKAENALEERHKAKRAAQKKALDKEVALEKKATNGQNVAKEKTTAKKQIGEEGQGGRRGSSSTARG